MPRILSAGIVLVAVVSLSVACSKASTEPSASCLDAVERFSQLDENASVEEAKPVIAASLDECESPEAWDKAVLEFRDEDGDPLVTKGAYSPSDYRELICKKVDGAACG